MKIRSLTHSARRVIAVTLLCSSTLLVASGCFGSFTTTHKVYDWNRTVDHNKWVQWGVFTAAIIVPVYPAAFFFDVVFNNSVEFWSGRNPMSADAGATRTVHTESGEDVSMRMRDDGAIDMSIRSPSQPDMHLVVVREGDSIAAYGDDGALVARGTPATEGAR
jgi:hypothetical protein